MKDEKQLKELSLKVKLYSNDFTPVHHELAELTGKIAIVQCLLDFAQRQKRFDSLLAWVERYNPAKYAFLSRV